MSVNGIEIRVGQTWRNRAGQPVIVVAYIEGEETYPWDMDNHQVLTLEGRDWQNGDDSDEDLIELISGPGFAAPVAIPEGFTAWAGGDQPTETIGKQVTYIWRGSDADEFPMYCAADQLAWGHEDMGGDITAYKILDETPLPEDDEYNVNTRCAKPSAPDLLNQAAKHMADRAATYDKPEGERSMAATVAAFNAQTGRNLTESEGWLLMVNLKIVRDRQRPAAHRDSVEDLVAYGALYGESRLSEGGV